MLDPFLGIGHSAFAAKECSDLVSKFIGFDIDEEYIRVARGVLGGHTRPAETAPVTPQAVLPL